jgi:hypothetical protein
MTYSYQILDCQGSFLTVGGYGGPGSPGGTGVGTLKQGLLFVRGSLLHGGGWTAEKTEVVAKNRATAKNT